MAYCTFDKTRLSSHINFIGRCLLQKVIPPGFRIKFNPACINQRYVHNITSRVQRCSREPIQTTLHSMASKVATMPAHMIAHCEALQTKRVPAVFHEIRHLIYELNYRFHLRLISD